MHWIISLSALSRSIHRKGSPMNEPAHQVPTDYTLPLANGFGRFPMKSSKARPVQWQNPPLRVPNHK
jgi:hypothetical protein